MYKIQHFSHRLKFLINIARNNYSQHNIYDLWLNNNVMPNIIGILIIIIL